jgi:hypothetical protein
MQACNRIGFSRGPFVYAFKVRLAPQETRTYFVTAATAQRRSLFQVTANAELFQQTILEYLSQGRSFCTLSSSCQNTFTP